MESTSLRISQIIKGLRSFSRDGSLDPMQFENLSTILSDAQTLVSQSLIKISIRLEIQCDPGLALKCQPVPLCQVFVNMILNAKDAIQNLQERWISISATDANDKIFIRIRDSGHGIPRAIHERIMEPFFTTKEIRRGVGLGLSISRGIVESHGGQIYYDGASPNTRFVVELPIAPPEGLTPLKANKYK
jgi:C4-dicarboxylate-specific signal transduction histidine kinase